MSNEVQPVETFYNWKVQPPNEDYTQLHPVPPPVFSRLQMTIPYNYKPLAGTVPVTSTNSRGEEVTRLINQNRYKGATYATASFFSSSPVPSEAPPKSRKPADAEERRLSELILQVR